MRKNDRKNSLKWQLLSKFLKNPSDFYGISSSLTNTIADSGFKIASIAQEKSPDFDYFSVLFLHGNKTSMYSQ